jgi:hypothetical protein
MLLFGDSAFEGTEARIAMLVAVVSSSSKNDEAAEASAIEPND